MRRSAELVPASMARHREFNTVHKRPMLPEKGIIPTRTGVFGLTFDLREKMNNNITFRNFVIKQPKYQIDHLIITNFTKYAASSGKKNIYIY